jgi:hypothetical protein
MEIRRNPDNSIDEVVAQGNVHIEDMGGSWHIAIEDDLGLWIFALDGQELILVEEPEGDG